MTRIFDDNPYLQVVPSTPRGASRDHDPPSVLEGDWWRVWMSGDVPMLSYVSGEQGGEPRAIAIEAGEVDALRAGTITVEDVLIRHHAG